MNRDFKRSFKQKLGYYLRPPEPDEEFLFDPPEELPLLDPDEPLLEPDDELLEGE